MKNLSKGTETSPSPEATAMPRAEGEQSMRDNNIEKSKIGNHNNSSGRDIGDHQGVYKPRSERGSKMIAGEGFDHSIPVEFGSNPGFDAFRAPNPDPKGYYAKAHQEMEMKKPSQGIDSHKRQRRRRPYESENSFDEAEFSVAYHLQAREQDQEHAFEELQGVQSPGRHEPRYLSPSQTPYGTTARQVADKQSDYLFEDHRHSTQQHKSLQATIETESDDSLPMASSKTRNAWPGQNRVVNRSRKRSSQEFDADGASETSGDLFLHPKGAGPYFGPNVHRASNGNGDNIQQAPRRFEAVDIESPSPSADDYSQGHNPNYFASAGSLLNRARNSGIALPWASNKANPANQAKVAGAAALLKRGIDPSSDKKVLKRASGASDPENVRIVNLRDVDNMRFEEIAALLNDERIKKGLNPSLTTCGVNGRYNRTAPVLYRAQGMEFVPPAEKRRLRKAGISTENNGPSQVEQVWTGDMDVQLVTAYKEYEEAKWGAVADMIEERTGVRVDETQCAVRFANL